MSEAREDEQFEGKAAMPLPSFRLETIKKRADFKAASGGPRFSTPGFTMLRRPYPAGMAAPGLRFGFTVTKKLGNAVIRNRIRRRLREAVRRAAPGFPAFPMDLVILARHEALALDFAALARDIGRAVAALALKDGTRGPERAPGPRRPGKSASS